MDILKNYSSHYLLSLLFVVNSAVMASSISSSAEKLQQDNDVAHLSMALKYARAANEAALADYWHQARENWQTAVHHIEKSDVADRNRAVFYYEYGHAAGISCNFDIAEEYIEKSYQLDKAIGGPYFLSLVEMFRLYFDQKNYQMAAIYFKGALPSLQKIGADIKTPAKYARLLDEYAIALKTIGKNKAALAAQKDAQRVRQQANILRQKFKRLPYGSRCEKKQKRYLIDIEQKQQVNQRIQKIREMLSKMNVR